jgi:hypothetical protein
MGPKTISKLDRVMEERSRPAQGEEPLLVAALAAALVEYRRSVRQGSRQGLAENARSNWQIVTRVTQLQRLP